MTGDPKLNAAGRRSGGTRGVSTVQPNETGPILLSFQETSTRSGVPVESLRDLVHDGHLPVVRFPNSRRRWIIWAEFVALMERFTERAQR